MVTEAVSASLVASAAGIPIGVGEISGGAPMAAGFVAQNFGIQNTLYVALFGLLVELVISFFVEETAPVMIGEQRTTAEPVPDSL